MRPLIDGLINWQEESPARPALENGMLRCTYPVTAVDAWSRILRALNHHGMGGAVLKESTMRQSGNAWTFEATIDGLSDIEEMLLGAYFFCDTDITLRRT